MYLYLETNSSRMLSSDLGSALTIASFSVKQIAFSSTTCVWVGFVGYRPVKVIIYAAIFQLPYVFWEFCTLFFTFISKRGGKIVVTLFKFFFISTIMIFGLVYMTYRPVHDIPNIQISIFQLVGNYTSVDSYIPWLLKLPEVSINYCCGFEQRLPCSANNYNLF